MAIECIQHVIHNKYNTRIYLVRKDAKEPNWDEIHENHSEASEEISPVYYDFIKNNSVWDNKDEFSSRLHDC